MVPLALALAWAGGEIRTKEAMTQKLSNISHDIEGVVRIDKNLYQGHRRQNPEETLYIAQVDQPSYGGMLKTAVVMDSLKKIQYVAILDSSDTHSYLEKVIGLGILDKYVGKTLDKMPEVDAVSGATFSSTAIIEGVERAAQVIGAAQFGLPALEKHKRTAPPETIKIILICLFFAASLIITNKKFKHKRKARNVLLLLSAIILGFWLGAQFSISTVVLLLNGSWLKGMATYAAILCLFLAVAVFLVTKKNLFCNFICPFGAIQEGIGNITGCSPPKKMHWMDWISRAWVLAVLLAALYFQTPADAMYEPFSKAFNFIGSGIIYALTILIVISSLIVKKPWCSLFCPMRSIFFYLQYARKAFTPKAQRPDAAHG